MSFGVQTVLGESSDGGIQKLKFIFGIVTSSE